MTTITCATCGEGGDVEIAPGPSRRGVRTWTATCTACGTTWDFVD